MGYIENIKNLEMAYDCAGICEPYDYFHFTDINRGTPENKQGCFN